MSAASVSNGAHYDMTTGDYWLECSRCETLTRILPTPEAPLGVWHCQGCDEPASEDCRLVRLSRVELPYEDGDIVTSQDDRYEYFLTCCECEEEDEVEIQVLPSINGQQVRFSKMVCECGHHCCPECIRIEAFWQDVFETEAVIVQSLN